MFKKINLLIAGRPDEFSLKQRIFSTSCFWTSLVGILFIGFSIIENHLLQAIFSFAGAVSFMLMYYLLRKKHKYNKWLFLLIISLFISLNWFFFNGLNGPSFFLFILGIITIFGIFERKYYLLIIIIVTLNILTVWFVELKFPDLVFASYNYRFTYTIISFIITSVFAGFIIDQLKFNYEVEYLKSKKEKETIEDLHNNIMDSIRYAKNIQVALLPSSETLNENLHKYFILFKPQNIVSGDFYWVKRIENKTFFVVADCTGHGVPGAFMSMLGISYLNEIIANNNTTLQTNEILNCLREKVKTAFIQNNELTVNDGMDIALCSIDFNEMKLQFSGAYNPLYLIRKSLLTEYKADRQPIGIYPKEKKFSCTEINLQKNDMLYMFSDGYKDQRGGQKGKKFSANNFKKLLITIHNENMDMQKEILNKTFEEWRNEYTNQQIYSYNELENILSSINKELITSKIKEGNLIIFNLKEKIYAKNNISISDLKEIINNLKINKKTKQKIINTANLQLDDVIVAGIKI